MLLGRLGSKKEMFGGGEMVGEQQVPVAWSLAETSKQPVLSTLSLLCVVRGWGHDKEQITQDIKKNNQVLAKWRCAISLTDI